MCRINIIYAKNDNASVLKKEEYSMFDDGYAGYIGYAKGNCNCSSFVGSMSDCNSDTLEEMHEKEKEKELELLEQVRELMFSTGYMEKKVVFQEKLKELYERMSSMTEEVGEYEISTLDALYKKYGDDIPMEETDKLYQNIDSMFDKIEKTAEYKEANQKYIDFISENSIMHQSTIYFRTREEQDQLMKGAIVIEEEGESFQIDDVIARKKEEYVETQQKEYEELMSLIKKLLQTNEDVLFSTLCCEVETYTNIVDKKVSELVIEDFAKLKYNEMIRVVE